MRKWVLGRHQRGKIISYLFDVISQVLGIDLRRREALYSLLFLWWIFRIGLFFFSFLSLKDFLLNSHAMVSYLGVLIFYLAFLDFRIPTWGLLSSDFHIDGKRLLFPT